MANKIFDPAFWRERWLVNKDNEPHRAVYHCSVGQFEAIAETHRRILSELIKPTDMILDAGCGYGRLLSLMPSDWVENNPISNYVGVDLSPEFIEEARMRYPLRQFINGDFSVLDQYAAKEFDWAILISIRQMIIGNKGEDTWKDCVRPIARVSKKILYLEYDVNDKGDIEIC